LLEASSLQAERLWNGGLFTQADVATDVNKLIFMHAHWAAPQQLDTQLQYINQATNRVSGECSSAYHDYSKCLRSSTSISSLIELGSHHACRPYRDVLRYCVTRGWKQEQSQQQQSPDHH